MSVLGLEITTFLIILGVSLVLCPHFYYNNTNKIDVFTLYPYL